MSVPKLRSSALGSVHFHVDGGASRDLVEMVVDDLSTRGNPSKLVSVNQFIAGPQRLNLPDTYSQHTPGTGSVEQLQFFSTTCFPDFGTARHEVRTTLESLAREEGIVVEVELVIGVLDKSLVWLPDPNDASLDLDSHTMGYARADTLPIEVHYRLDIPKSTRWTTTHPLSLSDLLSLSTNAGIEIGGWFLFEKADLWAYRSNMFLPSVTAADIQRDFDSLSALVSQQSVNCGFSYTMGALIERSVGVEAG